MLVNTGTAYSVHFNFRNDKAPVFERYGLKAAASENLLLPLLQESVPQGRLRVAQDAVLGTSWLQDQSRRDG